MFELNKIYNEDCFSTIKAQVEYSEKRINDLKI